MRQPLSHVLRLIPPHGRHGRIYVWRPVFLAGVVALIVGLGAGTSYAFIDTGPPRATTSVAVGSLKPVTVTSAATLGAPLLPGGTGDVVFSATNPNPSPVTLVGVALTDGGAIRTNGNSECTTTNGNPVVVLSVPSVDLPKSIPGNTTEQIDLASAAKMDATSTTNCQAATFTIPLSVTVEP
jgi:hypothetical protein